MKPDQAAAQLVATWMVEEFEKRGGVLEQDYGATEIETRFGVDFVYDIATFTGGIDRRVLAAFRRLTGNAVVWSRSERHWRRRRPGDKPGRLQD